ncbi:MAG: diguanylate cyclase domain-containing protein [Acidimicrobiales bacterium]
MPLNRSSFSDPGGSSPEGAGSSTTDGSADADLTEFWRQLSECDGNVQCVLEVVTRRVAEVLGEGSALTVLADDRLTLQPTAFHHPDPEVLKLMHETLSASPYHVGEGVAGAVAADRRAVVLSDLDPDALAPVLSSSSRRFAERFPIRSIMIVPLVAFGELLGTLGVMRSRSAAPYSDADLSVLEALAERAALALADARRGERRLGLAEYEAIFRHSLDGVLFTMPDGRILAANPAACTILQRSEAEICRLGRSGLVVSDDPRSREAVRQRALSGSTRAEMPMIRGDGRTIIVDVASTTFTTADGELRACVIFRDVTEQAARREQLEAQSRELEQLVQQDHLSGLLNRRGFVQNGERALDHADREQVPVQLLFCDLDDLTGINDRYGHKTGDETIKRLGDAIRGAVRAVDVAAHLSGDEFVMLLYDATTHDACAVLDRVTTAFEDSSHAGPVATFSAGIAEREAGSNRTLDDLLHAADRAMYTRKTIRRIGRSHRR